MLRDTFVNLAVILCSLLTTSIFADHHIELQPVFSESRQHTGYSLPMKINTDILEIEFNLLFDILTIPTWIPQCPHNDSDSTSYVHEFCANKQHYPLRDLYGMCIMEQKYGTINFSAYMLKEHISFPTKRDLSDYEFPRMPFGLLKALEWNNWKDYQGIDGVLGLAGLHIFGRFPRGVSVISGSFSTYSLIKELTRYEEVQFAIALPPLDSGKKAVLTLGGVNNELCYMGNVTTEPLLVYSKPLDDHFENQYEFNYNSIEMGNITFSSASVDKFAYLHTTQPFISVPEEFLQKIAAKYNAQNENNTYLVDCNIQLQPFVMNTSHSDYIIPAEYLLIKKSESDTQCVLLLKSAKTVALGLPFLHRYCVVVGIDEYLSEFPGFTAERNIKFAPII